MLHINMELHALPVQPAMPEAAGITSATKVSLGQTCSFMPLFNILCILTIYCQISVVISK